MPGLNKILLMSFFRKHRVCQGYMVHHSICKECESKERIAKRIGNLGNDPEMHFTPEWKAVTNFSLAVTEND